MMKRVLLSLTAVATLFTVGSVLSQGKAAAAASNQIVKPRLSIEVLVDARKMKFPDARPMMVNNSVLVPVRFVSDKLGGELSLVGKDITIIKGDRTIKLTIGAKSATVNGKTITLNAAADAYNGRTYVPLRFVSEAFDQPVEWDSVNQFVWIGSKSVPKLEDAIKKVDFKSFVPYYDIPFFTKNPFDNNNTYKYVRIITTDDLPLEISGDIYYRMDIAYDNKNNEYIRSSTTDKGIMGRTFFLLQKGQPLKKRGEISNYRESIGDYRIHYNSIVSIDDLHRLGIRNYSNLKWNDIEYVDILADSDAKILFKRG